MENNRNNFGNNNAEQPLYEQSNDFRNEITPPSKGYSIASLVLGIIGIVCCCSYVIGGTCAVLALVFAVLSHKKFGLFDGMALAGLILSIIGIVFLVTGLISDIIFAEQLAKYEAFLNQWLAEMEAMEGGNFALCLFR